MDERYVTEGIAEFAIELFPKEFVGVGIDVGAYDPFWISNSYLFEYYGWDIHCIEPNKFCIPKLREFRKNVYEYACGDRNEDNVDLYIYKSPYEIIGEASGTGLLKHTDPISESVFYRTEKIKIRTLDWLIENELKIDKLDYISIDVERNEMSVLRGFSIDK